MAGQLMTGLQFYYKNRGNLKVNSTYCAKNNKSYKAKEIRLFVGW